MPGPLENFDRQGVVASYKKNSRRMKSVSSELERRWLGRIAKAYGYAPGTVMVPK